MGLTLKNDIRAGFSVFLLALPLCLGIAMASNFPTVAGLITAIVGGVISTFLGSSRLTIKGPAAGLIVIALGAVTELGAGDSFLGYKRALATIAVAAVIQILFSIVKAGKIGEIMPPSIIRGMLAAIGVMIVANQSHVLMGVKPVSGGPLSLLAQIPHSILNLNPAIFIIGIVAIVVCLLWPKLPLQKIQIIPATLVVLLVTIPLAINFNLNPAFLVSLPGTLLEALSFPDFGMITSPVSIKYILMFALVGSLESILTVMAVDEIDPKKKQSDMNMDLFATGAGNLVASLLGGLPMISEVVRSKANVDFGAETRLSNFFHGLFLLISIALLPVLMQKIPLSALAALLILTGIRLASFKELKKTYGVGIDQFSIFVTTLMVTLLTDLLIGIGAGLVLEIFLHLWRGVKLKEFFSIEVHRQESLLKLQGSLVFTNYLQLKKLILMEAQNFNPVTVDLSECHFIDHTILVKLYGLKEALGEEKVRILTGIHPAVPKR